MGWVYIDDDVWKQKERQTSLVLLGYKTARRHLFYDI